MRSDAHNPDYVALTDRELKERIRVMSDQLTPQPDEILVELDAMRQEMVRRLSKKLEGPSAPPQETDEPGVREPRRPKPRDGAGGAEATPPLPE